MMQCGTIVIPTFRRPAGLAKLLARIADLSTDADLRIMVADNDPAACEGLEVVARLKAQGFRFPLHSILVAEPGVCHVRNTLLAAALDDPRVEFVALIDDDEWPEPQWLEALLEMQRRTGADAVGGTLLPAFAVPPPPWAKQISLYRQEQDDGVAEMIWGTCNVLVTRRCLTETLAAPWFDPRFGLTGGEDVDFFTRAKARGARFAWAGDARVFEDVPASRITLSWLARRAYRIGNTNAVTQLRWRYKRHGSARILLKSIGRLGFAAGVAAKNLTRTDQVIEAMCLGARSLGEMSALLRLRYKEYG